MNDQFEIDLEDQQLMAEIELVSELMIAAAGSAGHLEQGSIDEILGLRRPKTPLPQPRDLC